MNTSPDIWTHLMQMMSRVVMRLAQITEDSSDELINTHSESNLMEVMVSLLTM